MSTNSDIEWTDATWNPVAGCTPVSPGCLHCYAAPMAHRLDAMGHEKYHALTVKRNGIRTFNGTIELDFEALTIPLKWKTPRQIFVNSMSDLFHAWVGFNFIDRVFAVMSLCPQHTFQILTKRPESMVKYLNGTDANGRDFFQRIIRAGNLQPDGSEPKSRKYNLCTLARHCPPGHRIRPILPNVWLGTSVENRACLERISSLSECPAAVKFVSFEPLLEDLQSIRGYLEQIDWVIVGGESGPGARPCNVEWIRSIVGQCAAAGVPCFVKQLGAHVVIPHSTGNAFADKMAAKHGINLIEEHLLLADRKGGDPSEWPADLRVRQMPRAFSTSTGATNEH